MIAKEEAVANVRRQIEQEVAEYDDIIQAFTNADLTQHFQSADGSPTISALVTTGDLANFFGYHKGLTTDEQFPDIRARLLPLMVEKWPFDVKVAVPGNHDVNKGSESREDAERFKAFYDSFDATWHTPLSGPSVCIGNKPNQVRMWLLNSSKRCGIDTRQIGRRTIKMDTVQIFKQDIRRWREEIRSADKMRMVIMHHSPVPTDSDENKRDVFINNRHFNGTLIKTNVKLVLSGHHHRGDELYAAMPGRLDQFDGRIEPVAANPMIESGFLSVSAPTFLRQPARAGAQQGFNVVEIETAPLDNIATITVTKYRFTSENDPQFVVHGAPLRYRIALARLQDIWPQQAAQERRIVILENVAREIYSSRPIEPLERVLGIKLSDESIGGLHRLIDSLRRRTHTIHGLYSMTVLPPAAWWANQLTRRFRPAFLEHMNHAIRRGAILKTGRSVALFRLSTSLHAAVTQALFGAAKIRVAGRVRENLANDDFTHEERVWIGESLEALNASLAGDSLSVWGRNATFIPYDEKIAEPVSEGSFMHTVVEGDAWDIPVDDEAAGIRNQDESNFELARIAYWPIEDFDTDYALRVIEFHEDFHVPFFWLDPRFLLGRTNRPRKPIGTFVVCDKGPEKDTIQCYWNNIRGEAPKDRDVYETIPGDDSKAAQFWGSDSYPKILSNCPNSGSSEMRALLRRPDILFASDAWALCKTNDTKKILEEYLYSRRGECQAWLQR
jgi:3',5'-cyclic AMP phosphodiesterase CpdA